MTQEKGDNPILNKWEQAGDITGANLENKIILALLIYQTIRLMDNREDILPDADKALYLAAFKKWRDEHPDYASVFDYINMLEYTRGDGTPEHAFAFLRAVYSQVEKTVGREGTK